MRLQIELSEKQSIGALQAMQPEIFNNQWVSSCFMARQTKSPPGDTGRASDLCNLRGSGIKFA
jgi:hypothetical protein